jgi:hypothetical protein
VFTETVGLISHMAHELIPILLLKTRQSLGSNRYYTLGDEAEGGSTHNIYGPTTKHEVWECWKQKSNISSLAIFDNQLTSGMFVY